MVKSLNYISVKQLGGGSSMDSSTKGEESGSKKSNRSWNARAQKRGGPSTTAQTDSYSSPSQSADQLLSSPVPYTPVSTKRRQIATSSPVSPSPVNLADDHDSS